MRSGIRSVVRAVALLAIAAVAVSTWLTGASSSGWAQQSVDPLDAQKAPIYVSDFELFSSAVRGSRKTTAGASQKKSGEPIYAETDPAPVQARRIMDSFANTLVELLQKSGYTATRVTGNVPSNGVLLRGVFAEPDEKNRIRRAILGGGSLNPAFILYVATFNLAHQDQPLYQPAVVQSPDSHYGPIITMNAYVPMMKFEVEKAPVDEDVRRVCLEITSHLTTLLQANPNAVK